MYHARALEVLGNPALNRVSVIIFVIVCKVQLAVFSCCLLICLFSRERCFMSFMCVILFVFFLGGGKFVYYFMMEILLLP